MLVTVVWQSPCGVLTVCGSCRAESLDFHSVVVVAVFFLLFCPGFTL